MGSHKFLSFNHTSFLILSFRDIINHRKSEFVLARLTAVTTSVYAVGGSLLFAVEDKRYRRIPVYTEIANVAQGYQCIGERRT